MMRNNKHGRTWLESIAILGALVVAPAANGEMQFGFAKADATPTVPLRLSGYSNRDVPSEGVEQKLYIRAMAMKSADGKLSILANFDSIGIPGTLSAEVARRLKERFGVSRERIVVCVTHSHTAPHIEGYGPNLLRKPFTPEEAKATHEYTEGVIDKLVSVSEAAIKDLAPGRLSLAEGKATVAANRRVLKEGKWTGFGVTPNAPVDHSLPVLKITDPSGKLRGVIFNYACHCTTLGPSFNRICGDWAGYAQEMLEDSHAGVVAICTIGCGADANPEPRGELEMSKAHGRAIFQAVEAVLAGESKPIDANVSASFGFAGLPFDRPTVPTLERDRKSENVHIRRRAESMLAVYQKMGRLPETYPYPIQTWKLGDELTMIFLAGEVVVDYAHRLQRELGGKLWITAYANDIPGYVASERIRKEGGYEYDYSMVYYNQPGPWAEGVEDILVKRVHEILKSTQGETALAPEEAIKTFRLPEGFDIELVASEPLTEDPVNIAFGDNGELWVVEMGDYPRGVDGDGKPGGQIRRLTDTDQDGRFDKSDVFVDGLGYPTGVFPWRKGVLVCCPPELFYAEDTDGDGKADVRTVLFSGFAEANPQHRVNGFEYGLDGWLYIAGDNGGNIKTRTGDIVELRGRDGRIDPDRAALETVTGRSQFIRCRDDWGNWFGNNNSLPGAHYVIEERYLKRNPYFAPAAVQVNLFDPPTSPPVHPASRTVDRFNDLFTANRFTSACSPTIYRGDLFGDEYTSALFVCEPVHNLVHCSMLEPDGVTFRAKRPAQFKETEFLASTDTWSRPVRATTGPDGALWIVDMYRHVIEHPQWIPLDWQKYLDLRAGHDMGRVYRVFPKGRRPGPLPSLAERSTGDLAKLMESPIGPLRDSCQRLILSRNDRSGSPILHLLATEGERPEARVQSLWTLHARGGLEPNTLKVALGDSDPRVRACAIRLAEPLLKTDKSIGESVAKLAADKDSRVQYQLALTLGEWDDPRAGQMLAASASANAHNPWIQAAVIASAARHSNAILTGLLAKPGSASSIMDPLIETSLGLHGTAGFQSLLEALLPRSTADLKGSDFRQLSAFFETARRRGIGLPADSPVSARLSAVRRAALTVATEGKAVEADRVAAIKFVGYAPGRENRDSQPLRDLLGPRHPPAVQLATAEALISGANREAAAELLADWRRYSPTVRARFGEAMANATWAEELVSAIKAGRIATSELDLTSRRRLLEHADSGVRKAAAALLAGATSSRGDVVKQYQPALGMKGNVLHGMVLFEKHCATCHMVHKVGSDVGANLAGMQDKSAGAMLTAILDPSQAVEPKFVSYVATAKDGRIISGMVAEETANAVTLARTDGQRDTILRIDLDEMSATSKSFMPEGLERELSPQDLADVIAFVQHQPAPLGAAQSESANLSADLKRTGITGPRITTAGGNDEQISWLGKTPMAYCRQNSGQQTLAWESSPPSEQTARTVFRYPAALGYFSQPSGSFVLSVGGTAVLKFETAPGDLAWSDSRSGARVHFLALATNAEDATGVLTIDLPSQFVEPGKPVAFQVTGSNTNSRRWFGLLLTE